MSGITNPYEKYFKDGLWTFDGSVWRPQNQLLAYRTTYRDVQITSSGGAGVVTLSSSAVPANAVAVINNIVAYNGTTAASYIELKVAYSAARYLLAITAYSTITRYVQLSCNIVLRATEFIDAVFSACVAGDNLRLYVVGHTFNIAE